MQKYAETKRVERWEPKLAKLLILYKSNSLRISVPYETQSNDCETREKARLFEVL